METQPDLAPVKVLEEGVAVTQDGRTVEWWRIERPLDLPKQPHLQYSSQILKHLCDFPLPQC